MLTSFDVNVNLSSERTAFIIDDCDIITDKEQIDIPVYIPELMPEITRGTKKSVALTTKGQSVFINSENKPTLTGNVLHEQNYLTCHKFKNTTIDDFKLTAQSILDSNIQKMTYKLKKDTICKVFCLNSLIKNISVLFNNDALSVNKTEVKIDKKIVTEYIDIKLASGASSVKKKIPNVEKALSITGVLSNGVSFPAYTEFVKHPTTGLEKTYASMQFTDDGTVTLLNGNKDWFNQTVKVTITYIKKY